MLVELLYLLRGGGKVNPSSEIKEFKEKDATTESKAPFLIIQGPKVGTVIKSSTGTTKSDPIWNTCHHMEEEFLCRIYEISDIAESKTKAENLTTLSTFLNSDAAKKDSTISASDLKENVYYQVFVSRKPAQPGTLRIERKKSTERIYDALKDNNADSLKNQKLQTLNFTIGSNSINALITHAKNKNKILELSTKQ